MSGIVVLGMHRSGTSLLIGLLEAFGYQLGLVSSQTSQFKPTATKENKIFRTINNQLLASNQSSWDHPPQEQLKITTQLNAKMIEFSNQLRDSKWALKDPRIMLTYQAWKNLLPANQLIGTIREPLSVAISLNKKNNMPVAEGLQLWQHYNQKLLQLYQKKPFPILSFDQSAEDYFSNLLKHQKLLSIRPNWSVFNSFYCEESSISSTTRQNSIPCAIQSLYLKLTNLAKKDLT